VGKNPSALSIGIRKYGKSDSLDGLLVASEGSAWVFDATKRLLTEGDVVGLYWDQTDLPMLRCTTSLARVSQLLSLRIYDL